jgi:hypothetical protein
VPYFMVRNFLYLLSINLYIIPLLIAGSSNSKSWSSSCRTRIFNLANKKNIPFGSVKVHAWRQSSGNLGMRVFRSFVKLTAFQVVPL